MKSFSTLVCFKLLGPLRHGISKDKRVSKMLEGHRRFGVEGTGFLTEHCSVLGLAGVVGGTAVKKWTSACKHGLFLLTVATCSPC